MDKWQRRTAYYLAGLAAVMLGYTAAYHYGMAAFEGEQKALLESLQVVVETFTTTGFGSDAGWSSPQMNVLVVLMDLTGVAMIFLALPAFVFPLFREALSTTVPERAPPDLSNHVVVCTHTPRTESLIAELDSWDVDHVVVEPERETAVDLYEGGYTVVGADPESVSGLERARVGASRAIVADAPDRVEASIVLAAKEAAADVRVVSVVEDPENARYHDLAGADEVLLPRALLGESLARKVTTAVTADVDGVEIGTDLEIAELPIHRDSDVAGDTLAESGIRERAGANVVGAWFRGEFETPPSPSAPLDAGTVLLVTGRADQLEALKRLTRSETRAAGPGETVIVGYGEVGRTVAAELDDADTPHTVLDVAEMGGVDVVGDATDPEALRAAGVEDARSVVLALPEDTLAEFTTLVVRDLAPDVEVVARAQETANVQKMYRAGADYVLSLATISGRMLASRILPDENVISLDSHVEVVGTTSPELVGRTLDEAEIRARTGCTVVGVERDGEVHTDLGPGFRVQSGDELVVAGTTEGTNRFHELFG